METFLLSLWTLPAAQLQFSQVQFTFMMLFKSITYIQHAQKNFLKASCLHLCSNYLRSSFSLLICKISLCRLQGEQESLIFPETNELKTSYTCVAGLTLYHYFQIVGKFHSMLASQTSFFPLGYFAMPLQRLHFSPFFFSVDLI